MSVSDGENLKIFAGSAGKELAESMCEHLDLTLGAGGAVRFPDGEIIVKLDEDVRGRDCYVVQSTCGPVNENLMELLIWIDCLRRASARRITAVIPYFGYARQDRKDEGRVPITAKLVANLITAAGATRVLSLDLHAAQIQGFFDIPVDHLSAATVFCEYFKTIRHEMEDLVIVSPDVGNVKVANAYASALDADLAIIDKRRTGAETTTQENIIGGELEGKIALMFDDMISTAGSICGAAELVKKRGAREIHVAATHGVFAGKALERLEKAPIDSIVVTDSVPLAAEKHLPKIKVLSVASVLGEAIKRIHQHESISAIFEGEAAPSADL